MGEMENACHRDEMGMFNITEQRLVDEKNDILKRK